MDHIHIEPLGQDTLHFLHLANQPFDVIGRLILTFDGDAWNSHEVLSPHTYQKQYPNYDGATGTDYIRCSERRAFLAFVGEHCVGQILLCRTWNGYSHIEDLSVCAAHRRQGVGSLLLAQAIQQAKAWACTALSTECQDNNIIASRFLKKHDFFIGGVNTQLYRQLGEPYAHETAVFWYLPLT